MLRLVSLTFRRHISTNRLIYSSDNELLKTLENNLIIKEDFISEEEEKSILGEVDPYMRRLRYEFDHWDNVIHGYRETERLKWTPANQSILNRVKHIAFEKYDETNKNLLNHIHVLDLHENGYIKPHVDAVRFCGNTIAGLCLLSDAVMRLTHEKDKSKKVDALLKRRCLYIMRFVSLYRNLL